LAAVVALAFFIPLLIGTGGNARSPDGHDCHSQSFTRRSGRPSCVARRGFRSGDKTEHCVRRRSNWQALVETIWDLVFRNRGR
jgi:hypothetical protein